MDTFISLWTEKPGFTWYQALLIALLAVALNCGFCFINYYLRKETILECGYRKTRLRRVRKAMKAWSFADRFFLRRLVSEATESSPMLPLSLFLNYLNIVCLCILPIGLVCAIATCGDGWALILCGFPGIFSLFFSTAVTIVPDLLWVPSERRRYGIKNK